MALTLGGPRILILLYRLCACVLWRLGLVLQMLRHTLVTHWREEVSRYTDLCVNWMSLLWERRVLLVQMHTPTALQHTLLLHRENIWGLKANNKKQSKMDQIYICVRRALKRGFWGRINVLKCFCMRPGVVLALQKRLLFKHSKMQWHLKYLRVWYMSSRKL